GFYVAFEEVYKIQTAWLIPDVQLQEDLRISTSVKVIQAYRTFVGRHCGNLSDKSIKYSADDLESFLLDLFEGSPRSLHSRDPQNHCTVATDIEGRTVYEVLVLGFLFVCNLYAMGDCKPVTPTLEGEEDLIAAAQQIVIALETRRNLTSDARKILADLGTQLSSITKLSENKKEERRLRKRRDESMIWDCGSEEAYDYVKAVDEAQKLIETLESLCLDRDGEESELLRRAHDVVHTAMVRLEEEFRHMLVQNRQPFVEPEHVSFRSSEEDVENEGSIISIGEESVEDSVPRDSISRRSLGDFVFDLVHPSVIPDLKCIAKLMFASSYDRECTQAFISVQKDALDDCLFILEVEKLSIEDVLKMEWGALNSQIRRWIWVMKLLNFGEAIALGPRQPEKLVRILGMYEVLADLIPDIDALYADEIDSCVRNECQDLLRRLGYCVKATFLEFENLVALNTSTSPFPGGGIHHLTRYVMNYIRTLTDYSETLNLLLKDSGKETSVSFSPDLNPTVEDNSSIRSSFCVSPTALHFRSLISTLLCNLDDKSKLYKEDSLRHLFLMNNIHYMTQKGFYVAFEEVYKIQTAWLIPDVQLREDLRISTSVKVIQAYRTFVGRHCGNLSDKSIKYSADDLESFLLDLFEGSPRSLHSSHWK
ncbi:hypothetical protein C3L33_18751, partial [Rhododendron williamsianum]